MGAIKSFMKSRDEVTRKGLVGSTGILGRRDEFRQEESVWKGPD